MANSITLSSDVPVVAPGGTVTITAKVVDSATGKGAPGATVNWTITKSSTPVKLDPTTTTTSDAGYTSTKVQCDNKAAVTIEAALDDGSNLTATLDFGFYSDDLSAPLVPQATDGVINEKAISSLIQAMIVRHTDNPEAGDIYEFHWGKSSLTRLDDGSSDTFPWIINIKTSLAVNDVLSDGVYTVYYTVTDLAGNISYSKPLLITVTGGTYINPSYTAPSFPDATDNTINEELVNKNSDGVKVHVDYPQDDIFAGNIITLYMKVLDKNSENEVLTSAAVATHTVTEDEIEGESIDFWIDKGVVTDLKETFDDVKGYFWYTVTGSESVAVSGSSYTKVMIIDTVPPHFV